MKKKKEDKRQGETEIYVLSADTEQMIEGVRRAHQATFPSLGQLGKYTTVHRQRACLKTRRQIFLVTERNLSGHETVLRCTSYT